MHRSQYPVIAIVRCGTQYPGRYQFPGWACGMINNNMLPDVGGRGDSAALASRIIWAEGMIGLHVRAESDTAFGPQLWSSESASVRRALVPGSSFCAPPFNNRSVTWVCLRRLLFYSSTLASGISRRETCECVTRQIAYQKHISRKFNESAFLSRDYILGS